MEIVIWSENVDGEGRLARSQSPLKFVGINPRSGGRVY